MGRKCVWESVGVAEHSPEKAHRLKHNIHKSSSNGCAHTLFNSLPTHCTLHKHILCIVCVHQRENGLLIYTEGSHHQRLSIHVGGPWSPLAEHGPGNTHIHTHTGHYTHSPDERVRQRGRKKKSFVPFHDPVTTNPGVWWWIVITARAMPPTTGKDTKALGEEQKAGGCRLGVWPPALCV